MVDVVPRSEVAADRVVEIVRAKGFRRVLVGRGPVIDALDLPTRLRSLGVEVTLADLPELAASRDKLFMADAGITGVDHLVAETGTIVLHARPTEPRALSLLPPAHIAVADESQLLPDLFDLFETFEVGPDALANGSRLPSCLSFITGPSKTGDIELRLVTGVHGPGEVHVVLIDPGRSAV
jgi:L-lactate dehydrogenase complex protein LldG